MTVDLDQFHAAFFEESAEALDAMEAALLKLDTGTPDPETINTIFRGAHSIKGGAGMFGFSEALRRSRTLWRLFSTNCVRAGCRSPRHIGLPVAIRGRVAGNAGVFRAGRPLTRQRSPACSVSCLHWWKAGAGQSCPPRPQSSRGTLPGRSGCAAAGARNARAGTSALNLFHPCCRGNDPLRMFSELAALADIEIRRRHTCTAVPDGGGSGSLRPGMGPVSAYVRASAGHRADIRVGAGRLRAGHHAGRIGCVHACRPDPLQRQTCRSCGAVA